MKKQLVYILQGIPASGKSTWARKYNERNYSSSVIVSRDAIRHSLGVYWVPSREKLVSDLEEFYIRNGLKRGFDVIIDATNFNPKTLNKLYDIIAECEKEYNFVAEVNIKYFDIPLWKAIVRDWWRGLLGKTKVGKKVIKEFYGKYIKIKP